MNDVIEKEWKHFFPQQSKFNGISTKGHHLGWGKYLGTLAIMIDYLRLVVLMKSMKNTVL